ncbi:AI-2E family transporter [Candidatus Atelocyanobacterium thalassae]|uniref:Transport protein YhhT n=2 Tax=Candidatus Atelocyanobacterium thalassae TaxID=713887 RepID=A0ABM7U3S0_9CHRO|nr:AI-2E family transporter [Candidatus Atelocyanobacterium thalassa]KFF41334.1 MAG: putative permease [Candidatus Atelocyanobacterium thalassa isolate SIO64986]BDA39348.1 putative transport protein YhhT [cyanobacterium endosymbiont of Braarudosphaera bigelowii]
MNIGKWIGLFSLVISCYILWEIKHMLLLIFTAVIFATAINRLIKLLEKIRIPRVLGILIIIFIITISSILFSWLIVPPFFDQFQKLLSLLPNIGEKLRSYLILLLENQGYLSLMPSPPSLDDLFSQLQPLFTDIFSNFFTIFSNSLTIILQLIFIFILTIMMILNPHRYRCIFLKLFPSFYRQRGDEILTLSENALGNWLIGIIVNCLFIGTLSGLGLWFLQIRLVLVHALLAGLLNFIPNIGPVTSVIFPLMVALLDEPWKIGAIILWYIIIQNVESYWLTPLVMAKQVSLLPVVTLVVQIFFAQFFGVLGLLLALPLAVVAKTWVEEILFKDILDPWVSIVKQD